MLIKWINKRFFPLSGMCLPSSWTSKVWHFFYFPAAPPENPPPSPQPLHHTHLISQPDCVVLSPKKDVDTEGAHTRGIIQPPNRPRVGSVVLEYSGPLDGKEGLPLLLRFESSLLPPSFSTLQRARLREGSGGRGSKLSSTVLPSYPACFLGLAPWATPS